MLQTWNLCVMCLSAAGLLVGQILPPKLPAEPSRNAPVPNATQIAPVQQTPAPATTPPAATADPSSPTAPAPLPATQPALLNKELELNPSAQWIDTGMDLLPGDTLKFAATGQLQYANAKTSNGPDGFKRGFADLIRDYPVNSAGRGAVVGRIGSNGAARAFLIGARLDTKAPIAGRLFLAVNQVGSDNATGSYHVTIDRTLGPAVSVADLNLPLFTQELIDSIPRRVSDPTGAPGDRVNFIILGSQEQVQTAFKNGGWVTVDKTVRDAVLQGVISSLSKDAYVTMPMSLLQLFGRSQDFGYAQGEPLRVVASRHHFRIWKAPFDLQGTTVWVGAGTHDIGFDRDQRNNGLTHKIDPNVDGEREYIKDSLTQTGMVAKVDYITPADPITKAKTAHGEEFTSDGRTVIIYLTPAGSVARN